MLTEKDIEIRTTGAVLEVDDPRDHISTPEDFDFIYEDKGTGKPFVYDPNKVKITDQGNTPYCVGYTTAGIINNYHQFYFEDFKNKRFGDDGWMDVDGHELQLRYLIPLNDSGTDTNKGRTVRSGGRQAQYANMIGEYKLITHGDYETLENALDAGKQLSVSIINGTRNNIRPSNPFLTRNENNNYGGHNTLIGKKLKHNGHTAVLGQNSRGRLRGMDGFYYIRLDQIFDVCRQIRVFEEPDLSQGLDWSLWNNMNYKAEGLLGRSRLYGNNRQKKTSQAGANIIRLGGNLGLDNPVSLGIEESKSILDEFK